MAVVGMAPVLVLVLVLVLVVGGISSTVELGHPLGGRVARVAGNLTKDVSSTKAKNVDGLGLGAKVLVSGIAINSATIGRRGRRRNGVLGISSRIGHNATATDTPKPEISTGRSVVGRGFSAQPGAILAHFKYVVALPVLDLVPGQVRHIPQLAYDIHVCDVASLVVLGC